MKEINDFEGVLDIYRKATQWEAPFFTSKKYIQFHYDYPGRAKVFEGFVSAVISPFQLAFSPIVNLGAFVYFCVKAVKAFINDSNQMQYFIAAAGLSFLKAGISTAIILMPIFLYSSTMAIISITVPVVMIAVGNYIHLRYNIYDYGNNIELFRNTSEKMEKAGEKGLSNVFGADVGNQFKKNPPPNPTP